jgi:hypothetical protein
MDKLAINPAASFALFTQALADMPDPAPTALNKALIVARVTV